MRVRKAEVRVREGGRVEKRKREGGKGNRKRERERATEGARRGRWGESNWGWNV